MSIFILEDVLSKVKQIAEELALPVAEELGLDLYDVEYKKEGSDWRLTYFIDKEGGVSLNDCEAFSQKVSDILDVDDPIEQNYILTVSSPGIERKLSRPKHFAAVVGKEIEIKLFAAINGEKKLTGILESFENDVATVNLGGASVSVELKDIAAAKLVYHF